MIIELVIFVFSLVIAVSAWHAHRIGRRSITAIDDMADLQVTDQLAGIIAKKSEKRYPYVMVTGMLKSLGEPYRSSYEPEVTSVARDIIQVKGPTYNSKWWQQLWGDVSSAVVNSSIRELQVRPFGLVGDNRAFVEVTQPDKAAVLDLPTLINGVFRILADAPVGDFTQGQLTAEATVLDEVEVTVFGEVRLVTEATDDHKPKLVVGPPTNSALPYIITTQSKSYVTDDLESGCDLLGFIAALFGALAAAMFILLWNGFNQRIGKH